MKNKIITFINDPEKLEELYHLRKTQFRAWLTDAMKEVPDSETLKVWNARLNYGSPEKSAFDARGLTIIIVLSLLSFFAVKLPVFTTVSDEWFYPRFVPILLVSTLMIYFSSSNTYSLQQRLTVSIGVLFCAIVMAILPTSKSSASITMAQIHMPLFLLSFLAITYMPDSWKNSESRLKFIRYLGEVIIYGTIILLGGMVLTAITIGLFNLIDISIEDWYQNNVVILGLVATPLVATYLYDKILMRRSNIATIIANTFAPLFLLTVLCYLAAMFYSQKSPFSDRDFLITFNGLLILVWSITVFSIAGKKNKRGSKIVSVVNISLISTTLIINVIALSAITFRLIEYGITPNRVVVTGSNLIIFVHLALILFSYFKEMRSDRRDKRLPNTIAKFLPVYTAWSFFVVLFLPIIFGFK